MMELALDGGAAVRSKPYPDWPQYDEGEARALQRVLESRNWWRGSGDEVRALEREFAQAHGSAFALAVSSGTSALELALMANGVGPGDRVLVPAFTFVSTAMAVQRVGADPVLYDVDLDTCNASEQSFEAVELENVKAMIPVFMAGQISGVGAVRRFAERAGLTVIYDAAHAHGAMYRNQRIGELGCAACFSFQNFKLMTAGEGGMLTVDSADAYEHAYLYQNCGRPEGDRNYRHEVVGSNMRLNEFSAAVLRCQLQRLETQNARREHNGARLDAALAEIPGVIPQQRDPDATVHSRYMVMLRPDPNVHPSLDRQRLVDALGAEGIPTFRNYPPLYRLRCFWDAPTSAKSLEECARRFPNSEKIGNEGIWIHHRVLLGTEEDALDVARAVEKVLRGLTY